MAVEGSFREDLDVTHIASQYAILREFAVPGEVFTKDDIVEEYERATEDPHQYGNGPVIASSSVALVQVYPPEICHDVNGYYRSLGVSHRASKKELREAYQECGINDQYLTFVLKQLLDPDIRREYDLMPLGSLYMNDPFIQDAIKMAAAKEAARRRSLGHESSPEMVLSEWGFDLHEDLEGEIQEIPIQPEELSEDGVIVDSWVYSYFLWRSSPCEDDRLERWQQLIISALAERGLTVHFAVGLLGGEAEDFIYLNLDDTHVIFLNSQHTPNTHMAAQAADLLQGTTLWDLPQDSTY